jgi:hypothetical protein
MSDPRTGPYGSIRLADVDTLAEVDPGNPNINDGAFTPIGTGYVGQYRNPLQTPGNRWHLAGWRWQKKCCKSTLSRGFPAPPENRGVLGSIPSLAIPMRLES